jgi:hypothetical protein
MKISIAMVPLDQLKIWIPSLNKYFKKSEIWTRGRATVEDLEAFLYSGRMNLWLFYDETTMTPYGHMITEVKDYPREKWLVLQYCAGDPHTMQHCDTQTHDLLEDFAKVAGCAGIEYYGRPGWKRDARKHGFVTESVLYEKYL